MDPVRRTAHGIGAFAGLEAVLAVYVLGAVGSMRIGSFVAVCALATAALAFALARLARPSPPPPGDDGGGLKPDPSPDPAWWPDFERELEAYTDSRRGREPAATG